MCRYNVSEELEALIEEKVEARLTANTRTATLIPRVLRLFLGRGRLGAHASSHGNQR